MQNRSQKRIILLASVTIAVLLLPLAGPARQIYHRWRFNVAHDYIFNGPNEHNNGPSMTVVMDYHLACLVELDAVSRVEYTFKNITNDSPLRAPLVTKLLTGNSPDQLYLESPAPGDSSPMVVVVWCDHEHVPAWNQFFKSEDVLNPSRK